MRKSTKGIPKTGMNAKGVKRPHVWLTGPDEYKHSMYQPWLLNKAQANFRQEGWELSFEDYYEMWKDYWPKRGRKADDYCMTRKDWEKPWTKKNTIITIRKDHLAKQAKLRTGFKYSKKD